MPVTVERTSAERATVVLPGGRRADVCTGGRSFAPGGAALLMVRPERLHVGPEEPGPGRDGLPVTCTDLVFQGAQIRCAMCDPLGAAIVAHIEADEPRQGVTPGAALWVSWPVDAARLIPPEPAAEESAA